MSISFAAPPVIRRQHTPPDPTSSSQGPTPSSFRARHNSQSSLRSSFSEKSNTGNSARRQANSSPPPDGRFTKRVSFDTFSNPDASIYSLTLKMKHKDYKYTRRSRTFLIGFDNNEYSTSALEWLIDTFADDGDEIIALRVVEPSELRKMTKYKLTGTGSKLADEKTVEPYRMEARKIIDQVVEKNDEDKEISIIVELAVGNVKTLLMHMIHLYHPDSLIVGTRGRSLNGIAGVLPGSMSKWCLQNSPIPVIVVRPDRKRNKMKSKRQRDPNRRSYLEILEKTSSFEDLTQIFSKADLASRPTSAATAPVSHPSPILKTAVPTVKVSMEDDRGRQQATRPVAPSVVVTSEDGRVSRSPAVSSSSRAPSAGSTLGVDISPKPKRSKSPFGKLIAKVT